ncbi:MAG: hypothetical protein R2911_28380 [Caldilineaceae bacterium]
MNTTLDLTSRCQTPWRQLAAIMQSHQLPVSKHRSKSELIDALTAHLAQPTLMRSIIHQYATAVHPRCTHCWSRRRPCPPTPFCNVWRHPPLSPLAQRRG